MQSLALFVSLMILALLLSGPFTLLLTVDKITLKTRGRLLKVLRRTVMAVLNFFGILLSLFFLSQSIPLPLKFIAVISLALNLWAIDREYGGILSKLFRRNGPNSNGPPGQS